MATVYEATDLRLDRTVAVKIMHAGLADDDEFVSRFEREARSAARLAHHNVVAVFDQGEDRGTLFLVMEYVPGLTLRDLIRKESPMSPAKTLAIIEPILSALAAAHEAGMIHRDVKPENVLLADDGRIKVADFGLARAINSETQHTATGGVLIGTVSYLSPELVVDGKADARADVYATGVLIYEMLTGRKPHQADSPIQVAYKHVHEDIPAPSAVVPGIPPYVDALVARATARDKTMRPTDARVLLHQVRRVRNALDHGVVDDPELTEDLKPRVLSNDTDELQLPKDRSIIDPSSTHAFDNAGSAGDVFDQEREFTTAVGVPPPSRPSSAPVPVGQPRRSRRGPVMLIALLLIAALVGLGGWYFGIARYTNTPGILDLTQAAAKAKVEKAGLVFKVSDEGYSETVARGHVLSSDPEPGSRILKNGTLSAVISLGPERHDVPNVSGKTLDEAQALLQSSKLSFGDAIMKFSDTVANGKVIRTNPPAGVSLRPGVAVDVIVSKGPRPVKVIDFTGRLASAAKKYFDKHQLTVDTTDEFSDSVPKGHVIAQDPNAGNAFKGDTIALTVSKGPQLVQVPNVHAMGVDAATQILEEAGFHVATTHSNVYIGLQYVVGQSPGAGEMAPVGSTITLTIV
jgi:serine/threonine-protein kinase